MTEPVIRYTITCVNKGLRVMALPCQGRNTYETPEEAQQLLDTILSGNNHDKLASIYGDISKLRVDPVKCWPIHFDPVGSVLGLEE